jgi:hypothetical protein
MMVGLPHPRRVNDHLHIRKIGIASSGVFFSAQIPPALKKITVRKTRNLFLALPSIIFSIINWPALLYAIWLARGARFVAFGPDPRVSATYYPAIR